MDRKTLIKLYIDFFKGKNHKEIPNSSLIPENDPTVLFTTAGMHPLVPYLLSQPHPLGKRLCNVQRCIRTQDIDEVGDCFHHTFFEMLVNTEKNIEGEKIEKKKSIKIKKAENEKLKLRKKKRLEKLKLKKKANKPKKPKKSLKKSKSKKKKKI